MIKYIFKNTGISFPYKEPAVTDFYNYYTGINQSNKNDDKLTFMDKAKYGSTADDNMQIIG